MDRHAHITDVTLTAVGGWYSNAPYYAWRFS